MIKFLVVLAGNALVEMLADIHSSIVDLARINSQMNTHTFTEAHMMLAFTRGGVE